MIVVWLPTTVCIRRESRGVREANLLGPRISAYRAFFATGAWT